MSNVHSIFNYTYDGLNRATQAVCLLTNIPSCSTVKYKIDYAFDPVGNVTNRLITGLQGFTDTIRTAYGYDVMNRLTNVVQLTNGVATANAWYAYDTAGRLWKKGYGNGDVVTQTYDSESRLLSMGITNGSTMVTRYNYLWDVGGNILAITNNGTNIVLYGYDRAGQLTNEITFTNGIAGFTTNSWMYDEAGNWLNPAGAGTKWVYNADNELIARSSTNESAWSATVTGTVEAGSASNKWYNTWANCRGVWGHVGTNTGAFTLSNVPLYAGTNELLVTVTDVTGNTSQQTRKVFKTVTNCQEYFFYDGNGNLTNWISGSTNWVYEWDWADRMTKVSSNGVVVLENFYDAGSHRIAKAELVGSATVRYVYLYDGWDIFGMSSAGSGLYETYTRGVALAGDIGSLVGIARHPFNTKYYVHNNHRGDITHVRANALTLSTHRYTAFGEMIGTTSSVSRFRFSSKEYERSCGFYYYGYRFYAPQWQRWVNRDPAWDFRSGNLYLFVLNNPLSNIDPFGLKTKEECLQDYQKEISRIGARQTSAGLTGSLIGAGCVAVGIGVGVFGTPVAGIIVGGGCAILDVIGVWRTMQELNDERRRAVENYNSCLDKCPPSENVEEGDYIKVKK